MLQIRATSSPIASEEVSPGESMPDAWITRGLTVSRCTRKSANFASGPVQLRANAAAARLQIVQRHPRQQMLRRLDERFEREAAAFVVVLRLLVMNRRPQRHRAPRRLGQVHAEAGAR